MRDCGATILVVDDNDAHRYMSARVLRQAGYQILEARTGTEALELAQRQPDLVLLDVILPDMSGFDVARILKSAAETRNILILHLSSGAVRTNDRVEGLESGADAYLVHPLEPPELLATVKALLRLRRTERELRQSNETLSALVKASPLPVFVLDSQAVIQMWNPAAEELFGWRAHEVLGKRTPIVPRTRQTEFDDWRRRILSGDAAELHTLRVRKDGTEVEVTASGAPMRDAAGSVTGMVVMMVDMTERNRAERMLRNSERLAATGRLAASVAHEINNPLEAVTNLLYLLQHGTGLDAASQNYANLAQQELSRVGHIVKQMLGFYRESRQPASVGLIPILEDALALYEPQLRRKGIEVQRCFESNPDIEAYAGELRQVFSNLILNAIEASPENARISLRVASCRDWKERSQPGVRITILDHGPGIAPHLRRKLFEPFFTTKGEKGTGLGLWVSRGIVQKHRGSMHVYSGHRKGRSFTAFSVFLPTATASEPMKVAI